MEVSRSFFHPFSVLWAVWAVPPSARCSVTMSGRPSIYRRPLLSEDAGCRTDCRSDFEGAFFARAGATVRSEERGLRLRPSAGSQRSRIAAVQPGFQELPAWPGGDRKEKGGGRVSATSRTPERAWVGATRIDARKKICRQALTRAPSSPILLGEPDSRSGVQSLST